MNSTLFSCTCNPSTKMDFRGIVEHMKEVHNEEIEGKQITVEMHSHIDADTWYSSFYTVTTPGGHKFYRHCVCDRKGKP